MVLVWADAKSFRRHLEHMRMFRQSHQTNPRYGLAQLKNMPRGDASPTSQPAGDRVFRSMKDRPALVPLWEVVPPRNSQN